MAERRPTGRERMGSPTLQTLQDPILLIANALGLLLRRGWSFNAFKPFRGYVTGGLVLGALPPPRAHRAWRGWALCSFRRA